MSGSRRRAEVAIADFILDHTVVAYLIWFPLLLVVASPSFLETSMAASEFMGCHYRVVERAPYEERERIRPRGHAMKGRPEAKTLLGVRSLGQMTAYQRLRGRCWPCSG